MMRRLLTLDPDSEPVRVRRYLCSVEEQLDLNDEEVPYYHSLEMNASAVQALWDGKLRTIAREVIETVSRNVTIGWAIKESVRAELRVIGGRAVRKYGYSSDTQEKATQTVLDRAERLCKDWAG